MKTITLDGQALPVSNLFCIGRNYAAHAAELGNAIETEPMVFLKPTSALNDESQPIVLPDYSHDVHHECELVLLVGEGGDDIPADRALSHIAGYAIGLDLTARDVQSVAKQKGHPWAKAKGFRGAACVSDFVSASLVRDPQSLGFSLSVNGETRQTGNTSLMLFPVAQLVSYLSHIYGLTAGDLIFTGTPEGVAAIQPGDKLELDLHGLVRASFTVAA
ncbi:fumarylacetoacetate hydrolase family protein [Neisseriaceae bacterium JH1-16]|nr:fumarylacetoacetate hydrolase family protein [Neisseriaceae bacterium JH1-16]